MRIVLARSVQPEHGHDGVTDVLLDDPTLGLDRLAPASEVLVDDVPGVLGVEVLGQHREVDEVGEQDRDQLALLDPVPFFECWRSGASAVSTTADASRSRWPSTAAMASSIATRSPPLCAVSMSAPS